MSALWSLFLLYLLFLVQAALGPYCPDLLLLTVIAFAVNGTETRSPAGNRLSACGHGAFAGFLLDLLTPGAFGLNLLIYAVVGYGAAVIAGITWHAFGIALPLALFALLLRLLGSLLTDTGPAPVLPFAISSALTLALALPWLWVARQLPRTPSRSLPRTAKPARPHSR